MEKLERLEINSFHESLKFPDIQANMERLVKLSLYGARIEGLLSSIGERCTILISLHLIDYFTTQSIKIDFDGLKNHLQRLELVGCCLEDREIPFAIGEMSNLEELNLKNNDFSKLNFSISQLTRLKLLNLSHFERILELPKLPSSIAILMADYWNSLTDVGDFYVDCKMLKVVSLKCSNMVIDGNRILQSMLEDVPAENHCASLQLRGLDIPMGFTSCLRDGWKCTFQLPENWCSDFFGFLMCVVVTEGSQIRLCPRITIEQVITGDSMGMDSDDESSVGTDSKDDVIWKENIGDEITWVWYVPFDSLRHTQWWDCTYKNVSFSNQYHICNGCIGFGARLVDRKGGSGLTETSAKLSRDWPGIFVGNNHYTLGVEISHNSKDYLEIKPPIYDWKLGSK